LLAIYNIVDIEIILVAVFLFLRFAEENVVGIVVVIIKVF